MSVLVYDVRTWHRSGLNRAEQPRIVDEIFAFATSSKIFIWTVDGQNGSEEAKFDDFH